MNRYVGIALFFFLTPIPPVFASPMIALPAGSYAPFYKSKAKGSDSPSPPKKIPVSAFLMDPTPVTRAEFLSFLKTHPEWTRSKVTPLFADSQYLSDWRSDLDPGEKARSSPVTWVSWFAAKAYCESKGLGLPTTDQWEYAAYDQGRSQDQVTKEILNWYAAPNSSKSLSTVGQTKPNGFGIFNLFGLVWEWTLDFNSSIVGSDDKDLFCGNGSQGATNPGNYAAFMRESFRSSLKANYSAGSLGFRCAKEEGLIDENSLYQLKSIWTRHDGKEVQLESLRGSYVVIAMIYSSCRGACPLIIADLKKIERAIPDKQKQNVRFALFSFDPAHDTATQLKKYASAHDLDLKKWSLYRGQESATRELAAVLGLKYKKDSDGDFEHSNLITLLDPNGKIVSQLSGLKQDPTPLVSAIH